MLVMMVVVPGEVYSALEWLRVMCSLDEGGTGITFCSWFPSSKGKRTLVVTGEEDRERGVSEA